MHYGPVSYFSLGQSAPRTRLRDPFRRPRPRRAAQLLGTAYNPTPSGGLVLGGSAGATASYALTASGGLALGGSAGSTYTPGAAPPVAGPYRPARPDAGDTFRARPDATDTFRARPDAGDTFRGRPDAATA